MLIYLIALSVALWVSLAAVRMNQYPEENHDGHPRYVFGGPLLGRGRDQLSLDATDFRIQAIMRQLFQEPGTAIRSTEFMHGTRRALEDGLAHRAIQNPYAVGTAEHDAFRAGAQYGYDYIALCPQLTA